MRKTIITIVICFLLGLLGVGFWSYFIYESPAPPEEEPLPEEEVIVYLFNYEGYHLQEVTRTVAEAEGLSERVLQILEEMKYESSENEIISLLPENLVLQSVFLDDQIVYLDFNEELIGAAEGSSGEMLFLYSIVNSLIKNLPDQYKLVQFLVNGETRKTIGPYGEESGHIAIEYPLGPRWNLTESSG